jgi:hypothetical protein
MPSARSGRRDQAELAQQAEFVDAAPALHDPALADSPDIDPGQVRARPDAGAPKISPCWVPRAVNTSTTRSPSPTRNSISLCQSGKAARNMAATARISSRPAGTPRGGSWFTKSSAR